MTLKRKIERLEITASLQSAHKGWLIETHEEYATGNPITGALIDGGDYMAKLPDESVEQFRLRLFDSGGGVAFAMYHGETSTSWRTDI